MMDVLLFVMFVMREKISFIFMFRQTDRGNVTL